ncbi:hypothetical protein [Corynebacterium provencense]|uniref:hypothetical protein n=1 Tax=Corynebacterium provencense TaxID=1737425 RepID=UPI0013A60CC3|nr:hypothetical protein [Corynebacterium provencense]
MTTVTACAGKWTSMSRRFRVRAPETVIPGGGEGCRAEREEGEPGDAEGAEDAGDAGDMEDAEEVPVLMVRHGTVKCGRKVASSPGRSNRHHPTHPVKDAHR